MYQELGLLCVLFLPVLFFYFYRSGAPHIGGNEKTTSESTITTKKSKKKKKKGKSKKNDLTAPLHNEPVIDTTTIDNEKQVQSSKSTSQSQGNNYVQQIEPNSLSSSSLPSGNDREEKGRVKEVKEKKTKPGIKTTTVGKEKPTADDNTSTSDSASGSSNNNTKSDNPKESREIDEHMDLTPRYSRVMRITTEPEDDGWEPVPKEDGWESIGSSRKQIYSAPREQEVLTKKQRENQAKAAKRKQQKASAHTVQAERLRRHQKELERQKINEFYSTGAGKNTQWGKKPQKGSSKVPTGVASLNEKGQLIWD